MSTRVVRFDPFREIASLQNELSRFLGAGREGAAAGEQVWVPAVDVWETEKEIVYAFDLPGIPEDKISIELENNALVVSAERERPQEISDERFYRLERRYGTFSRTIALPDGIGDDAVRADYNNGVLELRIAKPEERKPRRIQIGTGAGATIEGSAQQT